MRTIQEVILLVYVIYYIFVYATYSPTDKHCTECRSAGEFIVILVMLILYENLLLKIGIYGN